MILHCKVMPEMMATVEMMEKMVKAEETMFPVLMAMSGLYGQEPMMHFVFISLPG